MKQVVLGLVAMWIAAEAAAQVMPIVVPVPESAQVPAIHGLMSCTCARHQGTVEAAATAWQTSRSLGVAGVRLLEQLPKGAQVVAELRYEVPASADSTENVGYKKFYATLHLKAQAAQHGANALVGLSQALSQDGKTVIFSATAAKVEP